MRMPFAARALAARVSVFVAMTAALCDCLREPRASSVARLAAYVDAICSCSIAFVISRSTSSGRSDSMIVGLNTSMRSITFARR